MRLQLNWVLLLWGGLILCTAEARRVRVRPVQQEEEEAVQYYQPAAGSENIVLVSTADQYNGLYGQPTAQSRVGSDNYIQAVRPTSASLKSHAISRTKESSKTPPVQTIRNYNKVNDDGSFTFGYEAADGSFKEETRGTDCVVRGKYGYIDPDGNKREFTYVSGNPCDPNAPKESEEVPEEENNERENIPANYPTRPIRPIRPVTSAPKPAVTLFQNNYAQEEEEQPEPEQVLKPTVQTTRTRPAYIARPEYVQQEAEQPIYQRPRLLQATTPSSVLYRHSVTPINITPRPATISSTRAELPATTYRPQLLQVAVTPRPSSVLYTKTLSSPTRTSLSSTTRPPLSYSRGNVDFDAEFQKFQQENNLVSPTPSTLLKTTPKIAKPASPSPSSNSGQIYSSALIYDPSSGQYNTQLYQTLPQTSGDFTLRQRIQPYVHQPQQQILNLQQLQQQNQLYRQLRPQSTNQAVYQQQQAELQFQNSAQLYAQQQKARAQQQQQQTSPQRYYYIQPSVDQTSATLSGGQIDAFLRGHNIQF